MHFGFGIPGLFAGLAIGNTLLVTLFLREIYSEDWHQVTSKIQDNIQLSIVSYQNTSMLSNNGTTEDNTQLSKKWLDLA